MNIAKYVFVAGFFISMTSFSAEIQMGENKLTCVNEGVGSFEVNFSVQDKVVEVEYYQLENQPAVPAWEHLETQLESVLYTSGVLIQPAGASSYLKGATMSVVRSVKRGTVQATIKFRSNFVIEALMLDHNHPEKYETTELGAQTFIFAEGASQAFFKCH
jgi:hypothetical protein